METENGDQASCFFCDDTTGDLRKAETLALDTRVRRIAVEISDTNLLAKLSVRDMVAVDAVYHLNCLASFYNKHRSQ